MMSILIELPPCVGDRATAARERVPVEIRRRGASDSVIGLTSYGIGTGQRVGAGDMKVILKRDQIGRLIGRAQGVEGDIGGHAWPALGAGNSSTRTTRSASESRRPAAGSTTSGTVGGRPSRAKSALSLASSVSAATSASGPRGRVNQTR